MKIYKFENKVGITIKVRKQVASYLAKKSLATHSTGSIGYYLCLFMKTQFQLGSYMHDAQMKHILSNLFNHLCCKHPLVYAQVYDKKKCNLSSLKGSSQQSIKHTFSLSHKYDWKGKNGSNWQTRQHNV